MNFSSTAIGKIWPKLSKVFLVMKLTAILMIVALTSASARGYSQLVTFHGKEVAIENVLKVIEKQTGYLFFYDRQEVSKAGKVTLQLNNVPLEQALDECLKNKPLTYTIINKTIVIKKKADLSLNTVIQFQVQGTVTDRNGVPLHGVNIQHKGHFIGTTTNEKGMYTISMPGAKDTLVFTFMGYKGQEIAVNGRSTIDVKLSEELLALNEVVVVAYGKQKRADITGSVVSVSGQELRRAPTISLTNSLTGLLPGVVTKNVSGEPGRDDASILIRGRNTTGNNSPLIVVDGIQNTAGWERINPNDIASISVLKDASAAIYGAQAANGVILITTKRGAMGKPVVGYNFNQGFNQPTRIPRMANSASLAGYFNELLVKQGQQPQYTEEEIQKFSDGSDPVNYPNVNWFDEVLKKISLQSQHNLSVRGGTKDIRYLVSGTYTNQNSIFRNGSHNFKTYALRSNLDADISKNIKVSLDINGGIDDGNYPAFSTKQTFLALNNNLPFMPVYWPNGHPSSGVERGENPVMMASSASGNYNNTTQRFFAKASFDINLPWVEGLGIDGYFNYRNVVALEKNWRTPWTVYGYDKSNDEYLPIQGGGIVSPQLEQLLGSDRNTLVNLRIKYDRRFGAHNINAFIAGEQAMGSAINFSALRRNFISTELDQLFAGSLINQEANGSASETARRNFLGRVHYDHKQKYLLDFNFRYDGSSNFPKGNRYGFFPGLSVAWKLSKENFIADNFKFIDNLKLRASVGQMGNDRIAAFQFLQLYNLTDNGYNFGNPPAQSLGLRAGVTPNPAVTWEVATITNLGLDGTFWNGLLSFTVDVFKQRRSNILSTRSLAVPDYTGLSLPNENIGAVENKGFELEISHERNTGSFFYRISGNIAYAKNKVLDIDEASNVPDWQKAEGRAIGANRYYISTGIIRSQRELQSIPVYTGTAVGDLKYEDINDDGVISAADMVRLDKTSTPEINYGFNFFVSYKAFSLYANFAGVSRVWQPFGFQALLGYNALQDLLDNRYTEGSMSSKYPTLPQQSGVNSLSSTFWLYNTSFLRLKTLELGYDLPRGLLSKAGLNSARIYVNGSNLLTFSKMKLFDPETNDADGFFYPQNRIFNMGLNLTF